MRMQELRALAREHRLRGYSQLRKAELIEHIRNDQQPLQSWEPQWEITRSRPPRPNRPPPPPPPPTQTQTWEPQTTTQPKLEAPLTKRQLKHRRNKDSKLAKKFKILEAEIEKIKSQMNTLKGRITKASESANARFKRKKIRSMKREVDKIAEKPAKSRLN